TELMRRTAMRDIADDCCPLNECAWSPVAPGDAEYEHFGWCPACGGSNGHLNIGHAHWYHCDRHRTKWLVGANLFSHWRHEDEATWARNAGHLADYRDVGA